MGWSQGTRIEELNFLFIRGMIAVANIDIFNARSMHAVANSNFISFAGCSQRHTQNLLTCYSSQCTRSGLKHARRALAVGCQLESSLSWKTCYDWSRRFNLPIRRGITNYWITKLLLLQNSNCHFRIGVHSENNSSWICTGKHSKLREICNNFDNQILFSSGVFCVISQDYQNNEFTQHYYWIGKELYCRFER